jgi:NAD(P)-dependent dehydrogenase (short-subunit alcohol dehydrogenase family)
MQTLGPAFNALVVGSSGTLGAAFVRALQANPHCARVHPVSRSAHPGFSLENEDSIAVMAAQVAQHGPYQLIIDATGALVIDGHGPEKHLGALSHDHLVRAFEINTIGPALLIKHLAPLLAANRSIYAKLSARVGSISDNHKGGWYGYRASKAALNMVLQSAAIELARRHPDTIVAALQPGTVASRLSAPFAAAGTAIHAEVSVRGMLNTLDQLRPTQRAQFYDYRGQEIAW